MDLPSLEEILERARFIYSTSRGRKQDIEARLNMLRREYYLLCLSNKGFSCREIAEETGIPPETARGWTRGNRKPIHLSGILSRMHFEEFKHYASNEEENQNLAYILGFFTGNTIAYKKFKTTLTCSIFNNNATHKVMKAIEAEFGNGLIRKGGRRMEFESIDAARYFFRITRNYLSLPWEHIYTKDEKISFLRGFVDARTHPIKNKVREKSFNVYCKNRYVLVEQMAVLCGDLDLYPHYSYTHECSLSFGSSRDSGKLLDYKIVDGRNAELVRGVSKKKDTSYLLNAFLTFRKLKAEGLQRREVVSRVCSEYECKPIQVASWYARRVPSIVKNYYVIQELRKKHAYGPIVSYLYREMGVKLTPEHIDSIARRIKDIDNIKRLHEMLIEREVPKEDYLSIVQERFPAVYGGGVMIF